MIIEVVLALIQITSTPQKFILTETGMMGDFSHTRVIVQHLPWHYFLLGVIQLVILVILYLVLLQDLVKLEWFLVPTTFPPKKLIFELMVAILCHLGEVVIQP